MDVSDFIGLKDKRLEFQDGSGNRFGFRLS